MCNNWSRKRLKSILHVEWITPTNELSCVFVLASRKKLQPELLTSKKPAIKAGSTPSRFSVRTKWHCPRRYSSVATVTHVAHWAVLLHYVPFLFCISMHKARKLML